MGSDEDSINNNTNSIPETTPSPEAGINQEEIPKQPNIFQRFASLFSKENLNYKRNRWSLALCLLALTGLIVAIVISTLIPAHGGELAILNVTPTVIEDDILGAKSHFIIDTGNGSVEKVRNAIYLEPAIDYEVKELTPGSSYEIIPASDLADNTIFNVDSVSNGVIAYKWAFQTKKDLSVSSIYPANGANYVPENSVIEFRFSYPDVNDVAEHFSISPEVPGKVEQLAHSWRFVPDTPFAKDATYEVTISAGLTYGEEVMTEDFHSSFSTYGHVIASSDEKSQGITLDGVLFFTETETPIVAFEGNARESFANSDHISIEKINEVDDYIKHLKGEQVSTEHLGDYSFNKVENTGYSERLAVMNQTLPAGYYIFNFKAAGDQNLYTANVEVNNLSAYAFESERDVVVWVAEGGELKSGIKVSYKNQDYETGADGLLKIENASSYTDELEYLKIGNANQPLAVAMKDFKNNLYPYGFIYTDRMLYAPNDTIKVWGYVPLAFFKESPNRDNFNIVFDEIKQQVSVDADGFFSAEIKLDNYKDANGMISLQYNDQQIAGRYMSVEDYTLENYTYEFLSSKNYLNAGESINFTIKVSHITGFPAINKDVVVTYDQHDYYATTNGQGEANFSLPTEYSVATWERPSNLEYKSVEVKSGGAEYNKYSTYTAFYVFRNSLSLNGTKEEKSVKFTAKDLDLSKPVKTNYGYNNLEKTPHNGAATIRFYEERHERHITGYSYNEYTKENTPIYQTNSTTTVIGEVAAEFVNGELVYNYPTDFKNPETDVYYTYYAAVAATDITGRPAYSGKIMYYTNTYLGNSNDAFINNSVYSWSNNPTSSYLYNYYRYGFKDYAGTGPYSVGDTLKLGLYDSNGDNVENKGRILAITYKESVLNSTIVNDNTFDLTFDDNLYPGAEVVGAYFADGKFYRIAPKTLDYDESDSELTVNIETNKESYSPGDTVKAKVTVARPDGSRASGKINLSVVNEAIFSASDDNTSVLSSIYANRQFKSYAMSTYRDFELTSGGGLGSAGGGRSDFGDTIFFDHKDFSNGEAEFEFKLNDTITSFRLTAIAVENDKIINAGVGTTKIVSSLPLSISTVMPKKVKNIDDLVLNATSITSTGDSIDYTFDIEETNQTLTASAAPGQSVTVNFGKLDLGTYTVVISATDSAGNTDKMIYPLEIVETAQELTIKETTEIDRVFEIDPVKNPIVVELFDKDTKTYLSYLDFLEDNHTIRLDTLTGYYKSLEYKNKYYNEESSVRVPSFNSYVSQDGTLKPLESDEGDYILTALANYYMPNYFELKPESYDISVKDDLDTTIKKLLVLSSFKEPVLLELKTIYEHYYDSLSDENKTLLGIAFAFVGDYDSASMVEDGIYLEDVREDLAAILSSFIYKSITSELIDNAIDDQPTLDYLSFAIISFLENNEIDLDSKVTVEVTVNSETNSIDIHPLDVVKQTYYSDDLSSIKITTNADNVYASYYYQGGITALDDNYTTSITAKLDNPVVGQNATLVLDISALNDRNGTLNIALPSNLKFSATFTGQDGLYLIRNNNEYIKLSLSDRYMANTISIPLYVTAPGNYTIEPIVYETDDSYYVSDSIVFDAK